ncbi:MAG: hypothetical protein J07HB67_01158 [halophilic archaeon J07HB67]|nr:MAG: hypothetical protein J07HB67_01158 [halophilic archaeon J07HB67]
MCDATPCLLLLSCLVLVAGSAVVLPVGPSTPDEPGEVRVVYRYEFPPCPASFRVRLDTRTTLTTSRPRTRSATESIAGSLTTAEPAPTRQATTAAPGPVSR